LLGAATAATAYFQDDRAWRFELARATDRCGLYLYLFGPLLAGIAAFETWTHKRRFADIAESLAQPASARMRPFVLVTAMGLALHVVVVGVYLGTALASDPYGRILWGLLAIQFAAIPGYVALGVLVGWWARSPLVAPAVAAVIILLNVEGPITQGRWRQITTVGLGGGDVLATRVSLAHAVAQVLVFLGLALAVWVRPRFRGWQATAFLAVGLSIAGIAGWRVAHMTEQRLEFDPSVLPYTCKGAAPAMCGPRDAARAYPAMAAALNEVAEPLRRAGVTSIPAQFSLDYPGSPQPPRGTGVVALSSERFRDPAARRVAAVLAMSNPSTCDDVSPFAPPPPDKVVLVRAMVTGWLAQRTDAAPDGRYPSDLVAALERLPADVQQRWLQHTFRSMWACDSRALAMPPGIPLPDYLTQQ
jgi:hypothetical protein